MGGNAFLHVGFPSGNTTPSPQGQLRSRPPSCSAGTAAPLRTAPRPPARPRTPSRRQVLQGPGETPAGFPLCRGSHSDPALMSADVCRYLGARYSSPRRSGLRTPAPRRWQHRPAECRLQRHLLAAAGTAAAAGSPGLNPDHKPAEGGLSLSQPCPLWTNMQPKMMFFKHDSLCGPSSQLCQSHFILM